MHCAVDVMLHELLRADVDTNIFVLKLLRTDVCVCHMPLFHFKSKTLQMFIVPYRNTVSYCFQGGKGSESAFRPSHNSTLKYTQHV